MPRALSTRLLIGSLLLTLTVLPLLGMLLSYGFQRAVSDAFDDHLGATLDLVAANVEYLPGASTPGLRRSLNDPRFERIYSGWYWQIDGEGGSSVSRSLWDQRLALDDIDPRGELDGPQGQRLRVASLELRIAGIERPLRVAVAASVGDLEADIGRFKRLIGFALLGFGLLLLVGLYLLVRLGLRPLRELQRELKAVERGDSDRLDDQAPAELAGVARAMNEVLARDRRLIEHGRAAAGNLAHALKTPISVLGMHAERLEPDARRAIGDELARIDAAVRHHLARASAAGATTLGQRATVAPALAPIVQGLRRIAERRGIALHAELGEGLEVRMDAHDFQEVIGNLLENAIHWADGRVLLRVTEQGGRCLIEVEDDGPGMSGEARGRVMARGARLDERQPGSGLGLAIADELVLLYGGNLTLDDAKPHGLRASVVLPLAQSAPSAR